MNDTFSIISDYCTYEYDVSIFNRWGKEVYNEVNYQNDWAGESPNGSLGSSAKLPSGTYY